MQSAITIKTHGQGLYEFTKDIELFTNDCGKPPGILTVFVRHTSCSLIIQENADPDVQRDLKEFFTRLVPPSNTPSMNWVVHTNEGPDDMPAHIKAAMNQVSIGIPCNNGLPLLGTWQGVYLFEHRDSPKQREVILHFARSTQL